MTFTPDNRLAAVPNPTPERQPAPDGWADAYRETLEHVWAGVHDAGREAGAILQASEIRALVAFAAEIREGIAADLISAAPVRHRMVPLVGQTRDELPRGALRHQAPAGVPFVSCELHGADCRAAQNGRPCAGMPAQPDQ